MRHKTERARAHAHSNRAHSALFSHVRALISDCAYHTETTHTREKSPTVIHTSHHVMGNSKGLRRWFRWGFANDDTRISIAHCFSNTHKKTKGPRRSCSRATRRNKSEKQQPPEMNKQKHTRTARRKQHPPWARTSHHYNRAARGKRQSYADDSVC